MKTRRHLLSERFVDDGRADVAMGRAARAMARRLSNSFRGAAAGVLSEHDACPLCGAQQGTIVAEKDRFGVPLQSCICAACGLLFAKRFMAPDFASVYYSQDSDAFKFDGRSPDDLYAARTAPGAYARRRARWIAAQVGNGDRQPKRVVEIGCADGSNLVPYHEQSIDVIGCDYAQERLAVGRRAGMDLREGGIERLIADGIRADLVIMSHVLEHVGDVDAALRGAASLLNQGGLFYVEVPGIEGLVKPAAEAAEIDGYGASNDFLGYLQFEHHYNFDLTTLTWFANRNGFDVIAGDEIVRALLRRRPDGAARIPSTPSARGAAVEGRLRMIEADYARANGPLKRCLRQLRNASQGLFRA